MSETETVATPTTAIRSRKSLRERSLAKVAERLRGAEEQLSDLNTEKASAKAYAIKAWLYAFDQGHEKYRPTLKLVGISKPSGRLQIAFRVAKWVRIAENEANIPDLVKDFSLSDLNTKATEELKAWGEMQANKQTRTQTTAQRCEAYVKSLYGRLYKAEDASLATDKRAKQGKETLPLFNARALMVRYLVMGAGKSPGLGVDAVKALVDNHAGIALHIPGSNDLLAVTLAASAEPQVAQPSS